MLLDRGSERELVDRLVADVQAGDSRALLLSGEAGVGKTALLEYLLARAEGYEVARAAGVQAEQELAFAAMHQLCAPMLHRLDRLPDPQREALRTAFGISAGNPPDRFMVGLAVLALFAEVARERPLMCVIDDAQWLDHASAQVLGFVARRLLAESVAMVFAVRDPHDVPELAGLAHVPMTGLPDDDARALWVSTHRGPVDERVLERVLAETRGNPLAVLELPRAFTPTELADGFGLSRARLPRRIEQSYQRQIAPLPPETRQLVLVAAVEPVGDTALVWRAAERLGISTRAAAPAEVAGLVEFGAQVRFRHPLVRSAVYRAATAAERRTVHRALAQATDPHIDPDRRAWHNAQAAVGADEHVAAELERSARRAQARGGLAAAASFLERSSELTPDRARRSERALAAAQARHQSGALDAAQRLLGVAEAGPLTDLQRAQAELLRARIGFTMNRGGDAPSLLLKAAEEMERRDVRLARDTYLEALRAAWYAAHLAGGTSLRDIAEAARDVPAAAPLRPSDLLLDGLAVRYTEGYAAAVPKLRRALDAFRGTTLSGDEGLRWLWSASTTCLDLCDGDTCDALTTRFVQLVREAGALATLPMALTMRTVVQVFAGDLAGAASGLEELAAAAEATGTQAPPYAEQLVAAWRGQERRVAELIAVTAADAKRRGEGIGLIAAGWMRALLCNGLGRYDEALVAAQEATEPGQEMGILTWAPLVELVTAASRAGRPDVGTSALPRLAELTQASGTDCALGMEACCRALVSEGDAAESCFLEAIEQLASSCMRGQLARGHLHYGEWLRRENRPADAQGQLRTAHEMFTEMGMDAFAELAARELAATGEAVRAPNADTASVLTSQEAQIARLAGDGLSNAEIATRLFISPRTVEWHLGKIFAKLRITSRRQLRR